MGLRDRFDRDKRKPSTRNQRLGFAFFWLLVLCYAYFIPMQANFNTESHLYVTFAIVDHHTLTIDRYHTRLGDESYYGGHYYSDKAPGLSFLAVPIYAGLRRLFPSRAGEGYEAYPNKRYAIPRNTAYLRYAITYLLVIVPSAVMALLLWLFLTRLTGRAAWSMFVAAAYALGTIAYPYSTWFFSHQIAAVLLFSSFLLLFYHYRRAPGGRSAATTGLAGLLAGYSIICEYPTALIAALLGVYLLAVSRRRVASLATYCLGMLPPAALGLAYNALSFGNPLATGYSHVLSAMYRSHVQASGLGIANPASYGVQPPSLFALWQITFGTYRGIFLISPFLLLFLGGLYCMKRHRTVRAEMLLCLAVVTLYLLMDASRGVDQNGWSGGWSVASRHLTPMLPFMVIPIAFGYAHRLYRSVFIVLAAVSILVTTAIVSVGAQFSFAQQNPLLHELVPQLLRGEIAVNWGYLLGLTSFWSLAPLCITALALATRIVWLFLRMPEKASRRAVTRQLRPVEG